MYAVGWRSDRRPARAPRGDTRQPPTGDHRRKFDDPTAAAVRRPSTRSRRPALHYTDRPPRPGSIAPAMRAPETRGIRVTGAARRHGRCKAVPLHSNLRRADLDLPRLQIRAAPPVRHTQVGTRRRKSSHRLDRQRTGFPDGGLATANRQTRHARRTVQKTRSRLHRDGTWRNTLGRRRARWWPPPSTARPDERRHAAAISTSFSHCADLQNRRRQRSFVRRYLYIIIICSLRPISDALRDIQRRIGLFYVTGNLV